MRVGQDDCDGGHSDTRTPVTRAGWHACKDATEHAGQEKDEGAMNGDKRCDAMGRRRGSTERGAGETTAAAGLRAKGV